MELALSSQSFKRAFEKDLDVVEFINLVQGRYGINNIELSNNHIKSRLPAYLQSITKALKEKDVDLFSVLCESAHLYDPEPEETEKNTNTVRRWMRIAQSLGAKAMRVYSGGEIIEERLEELKRIHAALGAEGGKEDDEDTSRQKTVAGIINGFRRVSFTAQTFNMRLLLENHDGSYGNADTLIEVLNEINHPFIRASVNTAGISATDFRYQELMRLVPYAFTVRIKTLDFDEAGNETTIDMGKCIQSIREANFQGALVLEYGGEKDEYEGVGSTIALVKKYLV